jgi:hypothetical protein
MEKLIHEKMSSVLDNASNIQDRISKFYMNSHNLYDTLMKYKNDLETRGLLGKKIMKYGGA